MRFLSMIRADESAAQAPSEQLMAAMGQLIGELTATGQLVSTAGLRPTAEGVRVRLRRGGELSVMDGPFTEAKEVIAGYAIFEASSREEAIDLTRRFVKLHDTDWDLECEVRQLDGPDCAQTRGQASNIKSPPCRSAVCARSMIRTSSAPSWPSTMARCTTAGSASPPAACSDAWPSAPSCRCRCCH